MTMCYNFTSRKVKLIKVGILFSKEKRLKTIKNFKPWLKNKAE